MLIVLLACAGSSPAAPPAASPAASAVSPAASPAASAGGEPDVFPAPARLVAVGDLHGDIPSAIGALKLAGVVDAAGHWSGGAAWLVQTGDVLDRGPSGPAMLTWLGRLETEAAAAGGRVIVLDGNHEAMNVQGDWRYVADLAEFSGADDAARTAARSAWLAPGGEGGAWIARHRMAVQVGGTVFVHGGIDAHWAEQGLPALNAAFHAALAGPAEVRAAVLGPDGPIWNRAYLLAEPPVACAELGRALAALHADRMVVGHTTQDSGVIAQRCEGRLYGIDTGISAYYGVHPSALVVETGPSGETVTVLPR